VSSLGILSYNAPSLEFTMLALLPLLLVPNALADRYAFDDSASSITFNMVATLHEIEGLVGNFSGEIHTDTGKDDPAKLTIQVSSMTTQLGIRDSRMHEYVLAADAFPTVEFRVHTIGGKDLAIFNSGEGKGTVLLKGEMKVRSATREIAVPAFFHVADGELVLKGEFGMEWPDYNLPDASIFISTLLPHIDVAFEVKAKKTN